MSKFWRLFEPDGIILLAMLTAFVGVLFGDIYTKALCSIAFGGCWIYKLSDVFVEAHE